MKPKVYGKRLRKPLDLDLDLDLDLKPDLNVELDLDLIDEFNTLVIKDGKSVAAATATRPATTTREADTSKGSTGGSRSLVKAKAAVEGQEGCAPCAVASWQKRRSGSRSRGRRRSPLTARSANATPLPCGYESAGTAATKTCPKVLQGKVEEEINNDDCGARAKVTKTDQEGRGEDFDGNENSRRLWHGRKPDNRLDKGAAAEGANHYERKWKAKSEESRSNVQQCIAAEVIEAPCVKCTAPETRPKRSKAKASQKLQQTSLTDAALARMPELESLFSLPDIEPTIKSFPAQAALWSPLFHITKIGQGGYAAIFRLQVRSDLSTYTVWKLMPLRPHAGKGSRAVDQTRVEDAAMEVKALSAMSRSPGFVEFRSACVLQGVLPDVFLEASRKWTKSRNGEDEVGEYGDGQMWLFIEMTDAGIDLECFLERGFPNDEVAQVAKGRPRRRNLSPGETWDIFWGIVEALAHGEDHAEFEHRDLHPGNVCIKRNPKLAEHRDWTRPRFTNYEITLIDYTLSRATLDDGEILANQMRDKSVFEQTSDIEPDRSQFEMYRTMRKVVVGSSAGRKGEIENWSKFIPKTNLLWLYHNLQILSMQTEAMSVDGTRAEDLEILYQQQQQCDLTLLEDLLQQLRPDQWSEWPWASAKDLRADLCFVEQSLYQE